MSKRILITLTFLLIFSITIIAQSQKEQEDSFKVESGKTAEQYYRIGNWYSERDQHAKAVAYYKAAIAKDSSYGEAFVNMGISLKQIGKFEESISAYNRAIELNKVENFVHLNLGLVHRAAGNHVAALASFNNYISLEPYETAGYANAGFACYELKDFNQAALNFEKLLVLEPENKGILLQLARSHALMESYQKTADILIKALKLDKNLKYLILEGPEFLQFRKTQEFRQVLEAMN